jgi:IclR family KDG regulon transcriptional repressor
VGLDLKQDDSKTRLSSVANAIRLIKMFSDDEYEIGISELAKRLGLAKSTVHRLATTLFEAGVLDQNPENGKYKLGLVVFELGSLVRRHMDFSSEAKPYLMALREKTNESVHLAIAEESSILYINNLESRQAIRMASRIGVRRPLHCTAEGKVLLAFKSPEEIQKRLAGRLEACTAHTVTEPAALGEALDAIREQGYALDDQESEEGLRAIAAPIRNHSGNVVAAVSVAGPAQRLTDEKLPSLAADVIEVASTISARLGFSPSRIARRRA